MMTARKVTYPFTLATRHTGVARTCEGEQAYTVLMEMWGLGSAHVYHAMGMHAFAVNTSVPLEDECV